MGTALFTKDRITQLEKTAEQQKLRTPDVIKQRGQIQAQDPLMRVIPPPRIKPLPIVAFAWLDPAQRKKLSLIHI